MSSKKLKIAKLGIGGPVGSGKTKLIEMLVPILKRKNIRCGIISNDVISKEDAQRMQRTLSTESKLMPEDMIIGIATGGCPHTAVREDPSMNLAVIEEIQKKDPTLDLIIIESGGDNVMTTFSPALADYFIYIVDVSGGDKYPRKGGLGIESCDLLVINKIDLAPLVNADLAIMENDARKIRNDKPFLLVNCKNGNGVEKIAERIVNDLLFDKESTTNQVIEKKVTYNSNQ